MKRWILTCVMLLGLSGWTTAQAQSCTITINALSSTFAYDPFAGGNNNTQGSFSISCTRPAGNNGNNFPATFWVGLSNGSQLKSGSNVLNYGMYQNYSACSSPWGGATGITFANPATGNGDKTAGPFNGTYCFRIDASQILGKPSASYSDTWTISVNSTNSAGFSWGQTAFDVTTSLQDACSLTTPPTPMTINYTSFAGSASGTSNFAVRCTNTTPYTVVLDQTSVTDNALNLAYTLALSPNSNGTGSGAAQSYTITGTMAAGQVGSCASASCTNNTATNKTRTLTVSY